MSKESVVTKKEKLKNKFEECFKTSIEEHLSEEGIAHFWSDNTSYAEAMGMLDAAAILMLFDSAKTVLDVVVHIGDDDDDDEVATPYEVERVCDHYFFEEKFETEEKAKEFIREQAMNSPYQLKDFRIVKVCD